MTAPQPPRRPPRLRVALQLVYVGPDPGRAMRPDLAHVLKVARARGWLCKAVRPSAPSR